MSLAPGAEALANSYGSDVQALAIDVWDGNEAQVTIFVTGTKVEFPVDGFAKHCLLNGIDQLGYILSFEDQITKYEQSRP